ncbi:MAG TPA: hypothetical protein DCZ03_15815 [Gammaproteobacteria bacterium]|nr:hypothetical protein [Gammaproteobacteria bacterium]
MTDLNLINRADFSFTGCHHSDQQVPQTLLHSDGNFNIPIQSCKGTSLGQSICLVLLLLALSCAVFAENSYTTNNGGHAIVPDSSGIHLEPGRNKISLSLRGLEIAEVMDMLSRKAKVNILLGKNVEGQVSVNLFDVTVEDAIEAIASAAGYSLERRGNNYFIVPREELGRYATSDDLITKTFRVHYIDLEDENFENFLEPYLSGYGKGTIIPSKGLITVRDLPEFVDVVESILDELDRQPKQLVIEAKILEVTLDDSEAYGIDWRKLFSADGGEGSFGVNPQIGLDVSGLFFDYVGPNVEIALENLSSMGRVRTLSTPKLRALENEEAKVIIGDRIGYRVTTTINQVTTESIEFLESGVILSVTPTVDLQNKILLDIHPEVSTGTINDGIPSQTATEVTTQLVVNDGQTVFMGGLIKQRLSEGKNGIPVLQDLPLLGRLFRSRERISVNAETIVLITPHLVDRDLNAQVTESIAKVDKEKIRLAKETVKIDTAMGDHATPDTGSKGTSKENFMKLDLKIDEEQLKLNSSQKPDATENIVSSDQNQKRPE